MHGWRTACAALVSTTVGAQSGWVQRFPAQVPPARGWHNLAFDLSRGVTVLFGGSGTTSTTFELGDTWEWDGTNWTAITPARMPTPRWGHAMAYDLARSMVVLFGGSSGNTRVADTWSFQGGSWHQLTPANAPAPRINVQMAHLARRRSIVLFGGLGIGNVDLQDTWEWNGSDWTLSSPVTSPPGRNAHGMVADLPGNRVVVFGGFSGGNALADLWAFDGTDWARIAATGAPPPGLANTALAVDMGRSVLLQFGGFAPGSIQSGGTWLHDGAVWVADPRPGPSARRSFCCAYDVFRGRTLLFGGFDGLRLADTWEYEASAVATWFARGSGCAGSAGVPALQAVAMARPVLGTTFQLELVGAPAAGLAMIATGFSNSTWNGSPLPLDLGGFGMPGCVLQVNPEYPSLVTIAAGRAVLPVSMPSAPSLLGVRFFGQGLVLDPGSNAAGAVLTNFGEGVVGSL